MKLKIVLVFAFGLLLQSCVNNLKNRQADILFEALETNLDEPNDSLQDTLRNALANFDVLTLDTIHQKEFWYNAYVFNLERISQEQFAYLDYKTFMDYSFELAKEPYTTILLIEKIKSYEDPRLLICLDFLSTTSSKTRRQILKGDADIQLDSLTRDLINDQSFVRVKKDIKQVYYPQHFDWVLSGISAKDFILKYHSNMFIEKYKFKPYPFSAKLRN